MREGWTYKKLGEVCETSSGGTPSKSHLEYYESGTIPWLRSGEVAQGLIYDAELRITDLGLEKSSAKIFPVDTVVLAMYGATVGQVGLLKKEMATNQAICGILPNRSFNPMFLLYTLKSKKSVFLRDAVGGAQPNISQNLIKNTTIPIPPLSEQHRIVSELDLLSSIIEKKKAQLKEYDQLAQSIFYDMFGDPVSNEKGWEVKRLGEVISVKGRVGWKGYKKEDLRESGPLAIGGGHITENGSLDFSSPVYLSMEKYEESPEIMVQRGDLIMVQRGTIGRIGLVKNEIGEATINPCVLILRPLAVSGLYVLHLMLNKIMQRCLQELVRGVAQPMITQKQVNSLIVPLPPLTLQQSFASKIEAIEQQKALVQQSITEVETLFNSRMDYYFN